MSANTQSPNKLLVVVAFAILYVVWGSTYFFIQQAMAHIPAFVLGALRFTIAGILMMTWCIIKGQKIFDKQLIKHAALSGIMLLFLGTGAVIFAEKALPSSLAAVLVASEAIWFVVLDKKGWKENFSSIETIAGLAIGFIGVLLLFAEKAAQMFGGGQSYGMTGFVVLVFGTIAWAAGSIYSKAKSTGPAMVNSAWQMLAAGIAFIPASLISNEWADFSLASVPTESWLSVAYLVVMGSLAGYSAYVWLLQVKPITLVSTHVYVNPLVAVLLGVLFANERLTGLQIGGLAVILGSVLLINLSKYRNKQSGTGGGNKIWKRMLFWNKQASC